MLKRKKLTNLEEGKKEIICQIEELRKKRDNLSLYITKLNESYNSGMINKEVYDKKLLENLKDKDHEYWEYHYESQINNYKLKLEKISEEIRNELLMQRKISILLISSVIILIILILGIKLNFTGLAFGIPEEKNFTTENITPEQNNPKEEIIESANVFIEEKIEEGFDKNFSIKAPKNLASSSFEQLRQNNADLPTGWYVQADGQSETDDGCLDVNAWTLINEKFSGSKGIMYISLADTIGCGIKLPNFFPPITGKVTATFNFKTNFTNPDSYMEILNYGKDNCNIGFNANNVVKQVECNAAITDAGKGWKTLTITNWVVLSTNKVDLYVSPPFILNQIGETGVMIFDDLSMEIE